MSVRGSRLVICVLLAMLGGAVHAQAAGAEVVLNEINCEGTDWIEIANTSGTDADISGWLLTDDPLNPPIPRSDHRLIFPNPTVVPAGGLLVVEKLNATTNPGGFPFGVSCGNDTIRLADATESPVDDRAVPNLTVPTDTYGRYPNGTGDWVQTSSTKGASNLPSSATGEPGEDLAAWLFDPAKVVEIDLGLPQASRDALDVTPTEYQDGTFSLKTTEGTFGPLNVGIRLKGGPGSFRPLTEKAAFKVKFAHSVAGQRFFGLKTLTLNNMVQDLSQLHETFAFEAFRAAGIAAPRTGYAYVRVNDDDYGLYVNVETLDDVSLPHWFDSTQHLYEGEYGSDVVPGEAGQFQVDEGSEADIGDLEALIEAAKNDGGDWSEDVSQRADLEQMTRMWAIEKYIGHWDGYAGTPNYLHPNNFYLHSDADGKFTMLPWGTDSTWDRRIYFDLKTSHLFDSCLDDASCAEMYQGAIAAVGALVESLDLDPQVVSTANLLRPWQEMDPRRVQSMDDIDASVEMMRTFLSLRYDDIANPSFWATFDFAVPLTFISTGPRALVKTRKRNVRATFRFTAYEEGARFECRLDDRPWTSCGSPLTLVVGRGRHTFLTRAIDLAGNVDATPASHSWRVLRLKRKRKR